MASTTSVLPDSERFFTSDPHLASKNTSPYPWIWAKSGEFRYVNAGHNYPILMRESGQVLRLVEGGFSLGIFPKVDYASGTVTLERGDLLLMFTDGVSEAASEPDDQFGEDRIVEIASLNSGIGLDQVLKRLEEEAVRFRGEDSFEDDFTLLGAVRV